MKKFVSILLAITLLASTICLTACGKGEKKDPSDTTVSAQAQEDSFDYSKATAEDLVAKVKDAENMTVDEYIWLINTYSNVKITDDLKLEENITDEAFKILRDKNANFPSLKEKMSEILASESPQVRGYAFSMMSSIFGIYDTEIAVAMEALQNESEPFVLNSAVKTLANSGSKVGVSDFLIKMSEHENDVIRLSATRALANSWSKDIPNVVSIVAGLMNDSNLEVQKAACSGIGKLGDDSAVDYLVKILNDNSKSDLHCDCVTSLSTLWLDYPFYENKSEKAYKATMEYWKKTPRTDDVPAWNSIAIISIPDPTAEEFANWKKEAKYYNPDEMADVFTAIILDPDMNWLGRKSAISIMDLYCGKDSLKKIKSKVDALTDSDAKQIQDELTKVIEA